MRSRGVFVRNYVATLTDTMDDIDKASAHIRNGDLALAFGVENFIIWRSFLKRPNSFGILVKEFVNLNAK